MDLGDISPDDFDSEPTPEPTLPAERLRHRAAAADAAAADADQFFTLLYRSQIEDAVARHLGPEVSLEFGDVIQEGGYRQGILPFINRYVYVELILEAGIEALGYFETSHLEPGSRVPEEHVLLLEYWSRMTPVDIKLTGRWIRDYDDLIRYARRKGIID